MADAGNPSDVVLMTFNVQNLFDGEENGSEYEEYLPPRWTEDDYQRRLLAIGNAVQGIEKNYGVKIGILALQEVEHAGIAVDLQKYYMRGLPYVASTQNPDSATQNIILSRYEIVNARSHAIDLGFDGKNRNRHILDVRLSLPFDMPVGIDETNSHLQSSKSGDTSNASSARSVANLQIIVVHLKSRRESEGRTSSEQVREVQYRHLIKILDTEIPSMIVGDFNDTTPLSHLRHTEKLLEYSLESEHEEIRGTYWFRGKWDMLDHVLVDEAFDSRVVSSCLQVIDVPPFLNEKNLPNAFRGFRGDFSAVSDHLPVLFSADLVR